MPAGKACAGNELARSVRKARSMSGGPDSARQRAALAVPRAGFLERERGRESNAQGVGAWARGWAEKQLLKNGQR